ncbi:MAG: histidine kinase [Burkholderiaceae bacterium]|nr:histidine kinase [Burkholderiaceae bacterium]
MPADAAAPALPLDQPLPVELTGRGHGWLTRYRCYPVYSPRWVRGRLRLWGVGLLFFIGFAALDLRRAAVAEFPWPVLLQILLQLVLPIAVTPWAAAWVRLQRWPPAREWRALVAVMIGTVALMMAFNLWGAEPIKQWVAERTGAVDASGKRKRVMVAVGVSVSAADSAGSASAVWPPEPAASGAAPAAGPRHEDPKSLINQADWALISFWLGGGSGLWAWRRQRDGLAALQRERELQRAQAERREAELRLSVLAAQVEPHFLFNTLAGVRSAISSDPPRAAEMIDRLVDYLRAAIPRLRSDGGAQATLGGQLDIVRAYLGLMAARMPRLQVQVPAAADLPPDLRDAHCPPLMLISLAENAFKHGVEPKIGPARIEVAARRTAEGGLEISVADDGVGFGAGHAAGSGLGLANIRERLQQLYAGRAALVLKARPEGGIAAVLTLPAE